MSEAYAFTETEFDEVTLLKLTSEGIKVAPHLAAPWILAYRNVKSVRLNGEQSGDDNALFRCVIEDIKGRKLVIPNTLTAKRRYAEVIHLIDNAGYRQFITALHQRLMPYRLTIAFTVGNPPHDHIGSAAILAGICSAILVPLTLMGQDGLNWPLTMGVIAFAGCVPLFAKYVRREQPETYSPGLLPEKYLPRITDQSGS